MSDTEPTAAQPPEPGPAGPERVRLRDRLFGLSALIAVAVAGVLIGGLAGFGIHAATDGDGRDGRMGRFGPGGGPGFQGGPNGGGPGGFQGGPGSGQAPQPPAP